MAAVAPAPAPSQAWRGHADPVLAVTTGLVLLSLFVLVTWPLAAVVAASLGAPARLDTASYGRLLVEAPGVRVLVQTVAVAATSTALTMTLGLAAVVARRRAGGGLPGRAIGLATPAPGLFVPLAFLAVVDDRGFAVLAAAQAVAFFPVAYLGVERVLAAVDPALEEAAESLGAGRLTILGRITLALAAPGVGAVALLVFLLGLADLVTPLLLGGEVRVLATEVYERAVAGQRDAAAAAAALLMLPGLAVAALVWSRRPELLPFADRPPRVGRPAAAPARWLAAGLAAVPALLVPLAVAVIVLASLVAQPGGGWTPTLEHYRRAAAWLPAVGRSMLVAAAAAVAGTLLALAAAYVTARAPRGASRAVATLGLLPSALPGTVVGLGLVLGVGAAPAAGSPWLAVVGVLIWLLPPALLTARRALDGLEPALEEAAVTLGAGRLRTLATVVVPPLRPAAGSMLLYFFVGGMVTVGVPIVVAAPAALAAPAAVAAAREGALGPACALVTILLGVAGVAVVGRRLLAGAADGGPMAGSLTVP